MRRSWSALAGLRLVRGLPREAQPVRTVPPERGAICLNRTSRERCGPRAAHTKGRLPLRAWQHRRMTPGSGPTVSPEEDSNASDTTIGVNLDSRISVAARELPPEPRVRPPSPEGDDRTHPGATTGVIPAHEVAVSELPPIPGSAQHPPERGYCTYPNHNRRDSRTRRGCSGVSSTAQNLPDVLPREATAHVQAPRQA